MDISKILKDVILLERGLRKMYEGIAIDKGKENAELAKVVRVLASESEAHARKLESRYGILVKAEAVDEGVKGLLSMLSGNIAKVKEQALPVEVLREGIKVEGYMEQLYKELADNYEAEEQLGELSVEVQGSGLKPSELFREIAADERKHQQMLQRLAPRIVKGDGI